MLVDRIDESAALSHLLTGVRAGRSGVLVLRGQPGIGKTALLDWAAGQAGDMLVSRIVAVESEMDLGFAGLHQVLIPFLGQLDRLPAPQREALGAAFGLTAGPAPNTFLVGLATLTLLSEAAAGRPVLCVVDDAQWLDRVSTEVLGFVARRLLADRVGMLFGVRDGASRPTALDGLPELTIGPLPDDAAAELLAASAGRAVDHQVSARIVAQTEGNPLALVEFGGDLTDAEAAGAVALAEPLRFSGRMEELYRSRIRALPADARLLLLLAAADQPGDLGKIMAAARSLGIDPGLAALPAMDRLVSWEPEFRFRHPLMRSAAYYSATPVIRRRAHEALAAASDKVRDPDRRAWHLASATTGTNEEVALELERSADRARRRGGWASGAAFLERSAELTADPGRRARRLLAAAEARFVAGEAHAARLLLESTTPSLADPLAQAKARRLAGLTRYAAGEFSEAVPALIEAARMIAPHDPALARDTLLDAFVAAQFSGEFGTGAAAVLREVQPPPGQPPEAGQGHATAAEGQAPEAAGVATVAEGPATLTDLLLEGFAAMAGQRPEAGIALLRQAVAPLAAGQPLPDSVLTHFLPMAMAASVLYDQSAWQELEHRWVAELRRRGALALLLAALVTVAYNQLTEGRFGDAETTVAEGLALSEATGFRAHLALFESARLAALARRGREQEARALAAQLLPGLAAAGQGLGVLQARLALIMLELGQGNYADALQDIRAARGQAGVVEVVVAGTRGGDRAIAQAAVDAFTPVAMALGTPSALGRLALSRALLASDADCEGQYQLAVEYLARARDVPLLARARLLYGEWLRRQRRRRDAREQLRAAWETFTGLGMDAFADRARTELRATGEQARKRVVDTEDDLTPQEAQIAQLASEGATNQEIAVRLFITASTVDYHLRKVFRKLGVTSRGRLARALQERAEQASRFGLDHEAG